MRVPLELCLGVAAVSALRVGPGPPPITKDMFPNFLGALVALPRPPSPCGSASSFRRHPTSGGPLSRADPLRPAAPPEWPFPPSPPGVGPPRWGGEALRAGGQLAKCAWIACTEWARPGCGTCSLFCERALGIAQEARAEPEVGEDYAPGPAQSPTEQYHALEDPLQAYRKSCGGYR